MKRMNAALLRTIVLCASVAAAGQAVADVTELPQDIQDKLYNPALLDPNQPIADSAYRDFVAKNPPPWKIGYASSYAGNTWRAGVMDRTLQGQGPKIQSILTTPLMMTKDEMLAAVPADCSEDSDQWYHPGVEVWAGKAYLDQFFLRPADPEAYDVASHPKP